MPTELQRFGGGGTTTLNPAVLAVLCVGTLLIFVLPRKYVAVPLLALALLIPMEQQVVVGGLHFMMARILILAGWARVVVMQFSGARVRLKLLRLDQVFLCWVAASTLTFVLLWMQWDAFVNRIGFMLDAVGMYFLLRYFIRSWDDFTRTLTTLVAVSCVVAGLMVLEQLRGGRNILGELGITEFATDQVRDGNIRSMGCFRISILAGTFGATLTPLFVSLWRRRKPYWAILGITAASVITLTAQSSGPVLAYLAGLAALFVWYWRRSMRMILWGIVSCLILMQLMMHNPIWHAITRLGIIDGSSSYHRYMVIDQFFQHIGDWWLVGTQGTASWGWMMWDTSNQYVNIGVTGGLVTLLLFLALLWTAWRTIGKAIRMNRGNRTTQWTLWAMGCALVAHAAAFASVVYFDQTIVSFYSLLAMIAMGASLAPKPKEAPIQLSSPAWQQPAVLKYSGATR